LSFGLNICTEPWALESYAAYPQCGVQAIQSRRATAAATTAKWLSVGVVAAARSGAFSLSSNRVDPTGACGGVGWIISPDGEILATTTRDVPFVTTDIDRTVPVAARASYHCSHRRWLRAVTWFLDGPRRIAFRLRQQGRLRMWPQRRQHLEFRGQRF
jgi:hypothetical protein